MENTMIDKIESMSVDFLKTPRTSMSFIKEKLTGLYSKDNLTLEFKYIMVAMSPNGGLIAMCKTKDYFDTKKSRINDYVIIMHQDTSKKYHIKIEWNYKERYIVSLEFSENGRLYGFCNDGSIYKFDILTEKAIEKANSYKIKAEKIVKAKLFDKGFIVLTGEGNIYLVKDLKDPLPLFIVSVSKQLGFSSDIDFLGIPPSKSKSGKFELLINNEKGNGVLHIEQQDKETTTEDQKAFKGAIKMNKEINTSIDISILNSEKLEKYSNFSNSIGDEYESFDISDLQGKRMGKINAMAMSPSKDKIALYCAEKATVYLLGSKIGKGNNNLIEKLKFELDNECGDGDIGEQKAVLSFHEKYQFLFCGEECLAIAGQRFIMIINKTNETIVCRIIEGRQIEAMNGKCFCKCITEIDGLRYITEEGVYLISPVCKDLCELCDPFNEELGTRKLIKAYRFSLLKNPACNTIIKEIYSNLPSIIFSLLKIAANLYWTEKDSNTKDKKEIQNYLLKAAQFGKSFVQTEDFNFSKFNEFCKAIRIIANMRNCDQPYFITYQEHLTLDPDNPNNNVDLVKRLIRDLNFELAFKISEYLGYDIENVYQSYAIARIKQLPYGADKDQQNSLFEALDFKLKDVPNISYIAIAKKCIKYKKYDIAESFLKNEKSILVKIPQYLQLKKWDDALNLCLQSCDWSVIKVVLDKIWRVEEKDTFIEIVKKYPDAHMAVVEFLKSQKKNDELSLYLSSKKNEGEEELMFINLEKFFSSEDIGEREECLKNAKSHLKNAKNIDKDFYEKYLDDLKNSLEFKKSCIEKKIIKESDISYFDNSIYDCFAKGVEFDYSWVDSQNRKYFKINPKKVSVLTIKALAKKRGIKEIEELIKKYGFKKLEISPLKVGQILYDNKLYDLAAEYIKQEPDPEKFDERIELLNKMQKYLEIVEIAMMDKRNDKLSSVVNDVLSKRKDLKDQIIELSKKYKVNMTFGSKGI